MKAPAEFFTRTVTPAADTCFVLMPFDEGMNAVYEHGIKPLVESLGIHCRRADEIYSAQGILGDIWESIQSAEFVIADLTNKNPNVMYELGLCHALWKRVILISQSKDDVPFDLRAWRVIWYDFTFAGSARLKDELQRAIEALHEDPVVESQLVPLPAGQRAVVREKQPLVSEWLRGEITSWFTDKQYGYIRSNEEDFYFNPGYLFAATMEPVKGKKVTFVPMEALSNSRNRRASKIFIHGSRLTVRVNRVLENKGYGFAETYGQRGELHGLLILLSHETDVQVGREVQIEVSDNAQGPIGTVVAKPDEPFSAT